MAKEKNIKMESKFNLQDDAKAGIVAVFLFALAILFIIGFLGGANVLGSGLNKFGGRLFGWGKWLLPVVLLGLSVVILLRKKMIFYISKIVGIIIMFLCILTMLHIYFDDGRLLLAAKEGIGGGYTGYFMAKSFITLAGRAASTVILLSVLIIGAIVTFNFSIITFLKNNEWFRRNSEAKEDEIGDDEEEYEDDEEYEDEEDEDGVEVTSKDLKNNIKKIEFVEDPIVTSKDKDSDEDFDSSSSKKGGKKNSKKKKSFFEDSDWKFPSPNLLDAYSGKAKGGDIEKNKDIIRRTFQHFGIEVESGEAKVGPTVTQYSFRPAVGVKLSRIVSLGNDLSLALAAHPIRIEAPIPGKSLVGVEIPNKEGVVVGLRDIFKEDAFDAGSSGLRLALGRDVEGNSVIRDLSKMPHLLVAGATGTGKSVCVNTILISLLYQNSPDDLKLILVDPKRVELSLYRGIPHLLSDVIVENSKVVNALKWAVGEMERRYILFQETGSKDLNSYRSKVEEGMTKSVLDPETGERTEEELEKMPYIVIVIDELADLMASHGKEVEGAIIRLAQMARAVGIHLIVSTQRPSVEVLTGLIKANITTRIALQVATQIDSRTILDMSGAEKLLGRGDMLFLSSDSPKPVRVQCAFVSENEIKKVVSAINKKNASYVTESEIDADPTRGAQSEGMLDFSSSNDGRDSNEDELYDEAKNLVIELGKASTSLLQRRLRVGYSRAARLIDMLEDNGVVGPPEGSKGREVLVGVDDEGVAYEDDQEDQDERDKWEM